MKSFYGFILLAVLSLLATSADATMPIIYYNPSCAILDIQSGQVFNQVQLNFDSAYSGDEANFIYKLQRPGHATEDFQNGISGNWDLPVITQGGDVPNNYKKNCGSFKPTAIQTYFKFIVYSSYNNPIYCISCNRQTMIAH